MLGTALGPRHRWHVLGAEDGGETPLGPPEQGQDPQGSPPASTAGSGGNVEPPLGVTPGNQQCWGWGAPRQLLGADV